MAAATLNMMLEQRGKTALRCDLMRNALVRVARRILLKLKASGTFI